LALTAHCPSLPGYFFSSVFPLCWMLHPISRGALREASARSSDRVAAWISANVLPPLQVVVTTFNEIEDSGSAVFGPTKILLAQLSELIPNSPPAVELLRMRKSDMLAVLRAAAKAMGSRSPLTPPDSPPPPPLSLCATPGCEAFPPPGHFRCADCAADIDRGSSRPRRIDRGAARPQRVGDGGGIDDLDQRIAALRTEHLIPPAPRTRVSLRASPSAPPEAGFSDSSEVSADGQPDPVLLCSALLCYRRKANPFTMTKQSIYAAVAAELAVARVAFPGAFPSAIAPLNMLLSELCKEIVHTHDLQSARTVYIGSLAAFLLKHAS